MEVLVLGLIGVLVGVVGSEFLRKSQPDLVKKVEECAERFTERLGFGDTEDEASSDPDDDE